ncbi:hypothetical protein EDB81DRAFT_842920 [Dactylonectria macrodidyma]|uniref:Zn(2)-C6 fungal-type domain-containing protein n=1 Tax=Dactylonectria macrodidyma TaxID=307937 RepID=A0A9P9ETK3_9HYPO|nr:hypothetical protein EDB81DRAFT_842920 [Dactylonectria macrodidyma]
MSPRSSGPDGSGPGPGARPGSSSTTNTNISNTTNTTNTAKLRRAHRKSRNGCWECKRRHIKCDEARPSCSNCTVSERSCSFPHSASPSGSVSTPASTHASTLTSAATPAVTSATSPSRSPAESNTSPGAVYPSQYPLASLAGPRGFLVPDDASPPTLPSFNEFFAGSPSSSLPDAPSQPVFTARHLILFHHAQTAMAHSANFMPASINIAIDWAQEAPYAMDQLLALAADHMAMHSPENAVAHRHDATELQTRALVWFNHDTRDVVDPTSDRLSIPRFLFAGLLSIHMLYETLTYYRSSYHVFIDRFIEVTYLHRGVRAIIRSSYSLLLESALHPFLNNVRVASLSDHMGTECAELERLIDSSDLAPATVVACKSACQTLQWAFNIHFTLPESDNIHAATAFPVMLTAEYVDALRKHRPEALLVLAYYGVLLHRCRSLCDGPWRCCVLSKDEASSTFWITIT